ncbi:MAG: phage minor capsid protein, partial [Deltaproteobacteria bacterium]|nr:phage minor capsid protein [Deltaproteobacteria bacterium]
MTAGPLRLTSRRKTPEGDFEEVLEAVFGTEEDFVRAAASFMRREGFGDRVSSDGAAVERELYGILESMWLTRWEGGLRKGFRARVARSLADALRLGEIVSAAAAAAGLAREPAPPDGGGAFSLYAGHTADLLEGRIRKAGLTAAAKATETVLKSAALDAGLGGPEGATLDSAVVSAVRELAGEGVTGYRYPASGASISLEPYVRREIVNVMNRSAVEMQVARAREWGADLIIVSAHAGARPGCAPWQGKVLSVGGGASGRPRLSDTTHGRPDGLFGINCRHYCLPWFDGLNVRYPWEDDSSDPSLMLRRPDGSRITNGEIHEATQRQRYMERRIRTFKRRAALLGA